MACDSHASFLVWMLALTVAALPVHQPPAVAFNHPNGVANLHASQPESVAARPGGNRRFSRSFSHETGGSNPVEQHSAERLKTQ